MKERRVNLTVEAQTVHGSATKNQLFGWRKTIFSLIYDAGAISRRRNGREHVLYVCLLHCAIGSENVSYRNCESHSRGFPGPEKAGPRQMLLVCTL